METVDRINCLTINLKAIMTRETSTMSIEELEKELGELEDTYAEVLGDDSCNELLRQLWGRIKELKAELEKRK